METISKASSITKMQGILNKGDFFTEVSPQATTALKDSIKIRNKRYKKPYSKSHITLDFKTVNEEAINKRGNLKVYDSLPKGIRVVAR